MLLLFLISIVRAIEITGTVIDAQGITICGVYITLYQQQKQLIQVQTKEDGTYQITSSESANLFIEATLNHNLQSPIRYPVSSNKQDFKLTLDDITVNGQAVLAKIVGQFFNGPKPLSGVQINYRIEYQDKGVQKFEFPSTSNEQGFSKLFTIYPKSSAVLKFLAQSENFWNEHQEKDTDDKYILIVNNEYKSTFTVAMVEGHFTQYVIGTVVDKITNKSLGGVIVVVTFRSGTKGLLSKQQFTTKDDGKFSISYQTLLWYQFIITIKFEKQFYAQNEMDNTYSMNHEDRTQTSGTWDLKIVQLPVQPHVILNGYVKDPNLKPVAALKISLIATFEDTQNKFDAITNKDGKWEKTELLLEPQATYTLKMTYTNDEKKELFFYTSFSTNGDTQQTITIKVLYYQKNVPTIFSGHFKKPDGIQLKIPYKINCDSIPPNLPDKFSDFEEAFDYTFKAELKGDQILNCYMTQGDTQMCQPFNQPFNLQAPDWNNDKIQIDSIVYNLFNQVVNGVIKDGAGLAQFIGDAKLSFTIYQKDKINVKSRELPTASSKDNGKYELKFPVAKSEIEYVSVKVTHIDFVDYSKDDTLKLPADKDQTWPLDITLQRIEFGQKDGVVLKYIINTLKQKATLKMKSSKPLMPYPKIYEQNPTTADGIFKLDFICYQNIEYTATFEISIEKFTPMMFTSNPFTCKTGEQEITSESLNLEGDFTVKFIDSYNQPLVGVVATFKTDPISDVVTLTSGKDGLIIFVDKLLFKNQQKYTGILTYSSQSITINFFTTTQKVVQAFPDQFVAQQITYTMSGKVKLDRGTLKAPQNAHVECDGGITKDGKTDLEGSFSISFQKTSNFNDVLKCKTTISGDIETKSFDTTFSKGIYTSSNNIVPTNLLDVQLTIKGQVLDPLNQSKKDLSVSLTLKYDDKEIQKPLITNKEGYWELKEEKIKANADYTFKLSFTNAAKQIQIWSYPQKYTSSTFTIKPKDDITFPISYFQDFETCHASGSEINPPKFVPATIPLKLTCESLSKEMKPTTVGNSELSLDFKYNIKVEPLVEYDKKLDCQLTSGNEKVAKVDKTLTFEGVKKWEVSQDLQITFVLWKIIIQGKIKDATGIEANLKDAKVQIAVHSQTKLDYFLRTLHHKLSKTNPVEVTVKDSDYSSSFQILNEEQLSADITATHEDFKDFSLPNAVQFGNKDETKTFDIKLERVVVEATLGGSIEDSGTISVSETQPKLPEQKSPAQTVPVQKGKPFTYPFQCYQNVEYTAKFKLVNDQKQQIEYQTEQPFTCKQKVDIKIRSTNDKVELKLSGKISDGDKIVDNVKDAQVQYEIKGQEKTVAKDTLTTNENGVYFKDKIILSPDTYQIYYTITHPQFTSYTDNKELELKANREFQQDFTLKRVVNSQKIKVNLQDATKKPLQGSSVSANSFKPKGQDDVPSQKGDSSGVATIEVQCFKGVKETFNLKIQIGDVVDEQKQEIDCDGKAQDHTISTKTQYVNVSGVIIDPYCEGKEGLEINLTSEPSSQNLKSKVQKNGKWDSEFLLKLDQQYQVILNYKDWQGNAKQEQQKYNIKQDETKLDYHKIFYEDKVDTKISGFVESVSYHGSLKFHNIQLLDEDDNIIAHTEIDQFSEYELKSQLVARCETKYPEKVFIKASQHFETASQDVIIIPPKFIYKNINLKAQETSAYKNEIKKFFSKFKITGSLESEYNCQDKLFRAVQHASVSIIKKQESGDKVKAATHTNDMGKFELYFFLSKKQVENNIFVWLNMEKEGFTTPFPLLIIPSQYEKFQMDEETVTEIDVGYQSMSPIKDLGCPEDVPKISSTNQLH